MVAATLNKALFIGEQKLLGPTLPETPFFSPCLAQVHSNNRHTQGVRVFSKVECLFKRGLLQPWSSPLTLPVPLEDLKDPSSRPISLALGSYAAQILRCKFYFADPWLLISEISFLSGKQPAQGRRVIDFSQMRDCRIFLFAVQFAQMVGSVRF